MVNITVSTLTAVLTSCAQHLLTLPTSLYNRSSAQSLPPRQPLQRQTTRFKPQDSTSS